MLTCECYCRVALAGTQRIYCWPKHDGLTVREGALALRDRIKSLIIRLHCVIVHSLRHDLIPVLGLARALQSQHMLLPALPRWAPKSNREPFGAIKPWLIGEKEPSGCLISPIFISPPTHHIYLPCRVYFHMWLLYLWLWCFYDFKISF